MVISYRLVTKNTVTCACAALAVVCSGPETINVRHTVTAAAAYKMNPKMNRDQHEEEPSRKRKSKKQELREQMRKQMREEARLEIEELIKQETKRIDETIAKEQAEALSKFPPGIFREEVAKLLAPKLAKKKADMVEEFRRNAWKGIEEAEEEEFGGESEEESGEDSVGSGSGAESQENEQSESEEESEEESQENEQSEISRAESVEESQSVEDSDPNEFESCFSSDSVQEVPQKPSGSPEQSPQSPQISFDKEAGELIEQPLEPLEHPLEQGTNTMNCHSNCQSRQAIKERVQKEFDRAKEITRRRREAEEKMRKVIAFGLPGCNTGMKHLNTDINKNINKEGQSSNEYAEQYANKYTKEHIEAANRRIELCRRRNFPERSFPERYVDGRYLSCKERYLAKRRNREEYNRRLEEDPEFAGKEAEKEAERAKILEAEREKYWDEQYERERYMKSITVVVPPPTPPKEIESPKNKDAEEVAALLGAALKAVSTALANPPNAPAAKRSKKESGDAPAKKESGDDSEDKSGDDSEDKSGDDSEDKSGEESGDPDCTIF
jgi:hypothetical protein